MSATEPGAPVEPGHGMPPGGVSGVVEAPERLIGLQAPDYNTLVVERRHPHARIPRRQTAGSAGFDLHACEAALIPARGRALVKTGLALGISPGYYGRIAPRSSLALKHGLDVGAGVVDSDYRGEVGVVLFNHSDADYPVATGDRVAQLILVRIGNHVGVVENTLDITFRGWGGFGSTGK